MITAASQPVRLDGKAFAARMTKRLATEVAEAVAKTGTCLGLPLSWSVRIRQVRSMCVQNNEPL